MGESAATTRQPAPLWAREAAAAGLRLADTLPERLDDSITTLVSEDLAREFRVVPCGRGEGRILLAAAAWRQALSRLPELEFALGPVEILAAEPALVHALIARHYAGSSIPDLDSSATTAAPLPPAETALGPGTARYVDSILAYAFRVGASDIHFEPQGSSFRIRMRVDGAMRSLPELPAQAGPTVVTRLKVMAGLDIGVARKAQDGRIRLKNRDLRLATLPGVSGECAVLRLLDEARRLRTLEELGMPDACREELKGVCAGQGLILSCGPTGSGKTTTLHAILCQLNEPSRKILTIEDPVEYELPGAVQVQARPEIGLGFPRVLRSFLRHDPDVILVGEIRDTETARIAMQAALTGHLVLASLHCRGAAEAPMRLVELGVEPWLAGSALKLAVAQRLVRKICTECEGAGCEECGNSGFSGRTALFEWLRMNAELAALLDSGRVADYVREAANAMPQTMADACTELIRRGVTTREEAATQVDLEGIAPKESTLLPEA
jgi:general secretion pathway protein E